MFRLLGDFCLVGLFGNACWVFVGAFVGWFYRFEVGLILYAFACFVLVMVACW